MIHFITDIVGDHEPDIIQQVKDETLTFRTDDSVIARVEPKGSWTHKELTCLEYPAVVKTALQSGDVIEAYLGEEWVGSTEV